MTKGSASPHKPQVKQMVMRRLSCNRSPPDSSKPTSNDKELQGEEEDSTSKGKRSHHKKKSCSVSGCKFFGSDLKCHLKLHVRRGEIAEESIAHLATTMTIGKKQRGKQVRDGLQEWEKKTWLIKKVVPSANCSSIILNVTASRRTPVSAKTW